MRLWLRRNDVDEYDVKYGAWRLYDIIYDDLQHNISIMPQNGALNLAKKMLGNDRLDVFIWALNEYYENGNGLILNCSSNEYLPSLKLFLGLFSGVNDYCRCMYQIDEDLVQRLVVSGTKPLDCVSRAKEYMDLAEEFWAQRDKYINMKLRGQ